MSSTNDVTKTHNHAAGKIQNSSVVSEIRLPSSAYKLQSWKVQQGSVVRKGETIALAVLGDATSGNNDAATAADSGTAVDSSQSQVPSSQRPSTSQYKRPAKRRRKIIPSSQVKQETILSTKSSSSDKKAASAATEKVAATADKATAPRLPAVVSRALASKPTAASGTSSEATTTTHDPKETTLPSSQTTKRPATEMSTTAPESAATIHNKTTQSHSAETKPIPILAESDGIIQCGKPIDYPSADSDLVIGLILACEHPAVMDGLCVLCGNQVTGKRNPSTTGSASNNVVGSTGDTYGEDQNSMDDRAEGSGETLSRVTVSGGITMTISASEGQRMAEQHANHLHKQSKLSLVLDLDHTLLHATNDCRARRHQGRPDVRTLILPLQVDAEPSPNAMWMEHFVKLRPHVKEFLEQASATFEIGVYTAGTRQYAEQVTLLLARHMVGSRWDQTGLDYLRHRVASMAQQLEKQKHEKELAKKQEDEKAKASNPDDETGGKRKVRFGESKERTDAVTEEDLEKLRSELREAERMEQQALECRQRLFGTRIVSRTDVADLGINVKSLKRIFPCGGSMAVVVDDREDVWANASDNKIKGEPPDSLLLVRPYHWGPFVGFADVNNPSGKDHGADNNEDLERDNDEQLLWIADILRRIHEKYYETFEDNPQPGKRSVPEIIREMRQQVLKNTCLVLSGMVPLHKQQATPRHDYVRYAENLGARLVWSVTPEVTHVVSANDGTDKVLAARRVPGCHIVKPLWLMECVWTMTRRDVRPHLWPPGKVAPRKPTSSVKEPEEDKEIEGATQMSSATAEEEEMGTDREIYPVVALEDDEDDKPAFRIVDDDDDDDYDDDDLVADLEESY